MVFEKLPRAFGAGGPGVETVLDRTRVRPGEQVTGQVHVEGGEHDADVEHLALGLVTRAGDDDPVEFHRAVVSGPFRLAAGERRSIAFTVGMPWETPLTNVDGTTLGARTEVSVAGTVDAGAVDCLHVSPLSSQERVLDAFARLGFVCTGSALEQGRIGGAHQELPLFQALVLRPPAARSGHAGEVQLAFVADRHHLAVVLEADRRGGPFGGGRGDFGRWIFPHETAIRTDWAGLVDGWLDELPGHVSRSSRPLWSDR